MSSGKQPAEITALGELITHDLEEDKDVSIFTISQVLVALAISILGGLYSLFGAALSTPGGAALISMLGLGLVVFPWVGVWASTNERHLIAMACFAYPVALLIQLGSFFPVLAVSSGVLAMIHLVKAVRA